MGNLNCLKVASNLTYLSDVAEKNNIYLYQVSD